jgi:peptide/nickel transport system substrate-binding protein
MERLMVLIGRRSFLGGAAASSATFMTLEQAIAQTRGTLVIGSSLVTRSLNHAVVTGVTTMTAGAQIFASLLTVGADWKPRPYLAESLEVSADYLTVTVKLRRNAVFHDGQPITSDDVKFSLEAIKAHHPFRTMLEPVKSIEARDALTVVIQLSAPHPALPLALTHPLCAIMPKHIYGDGTPLPTHPRNTANVVGSGAFKVVEFKPGEHLILERNDRFFLPDSPKLGRIIHRFLKDEATALLALERGEVDFLMSMDLREVARARRNTALSTTEQLMPGAGLITWLSFNCKHPQLQDKRVRQAINYAIDKEFIAGTLFAGGHARATGPVTRGSPLYEPQVEAYKLDLAKSAALLDAAGLKAGADGTRLTVNVDSFPGFAQFRPIVDYLRVALGKVGVVANIRTSADSATWAKRIGTYDFDLHVEQVYNWGDPIIGVHRSWISSNIRQGVVFSNTHQYSNPEVDRLASEAGREPDPAKRKALYSAFQKTIVDDCSAAFILDCNWPSAWSKNVVNPPSSIWGTNVGWDDVDIRKS